MTTGDAIFLKLSTSAPIKAKVEDRIFPVRYNEKGIGDYIIYQGIGGTPLSTHREAAQRSFTMVQFSCWSDTYEAAAALRDVLISALDNQTLANGEIGQLEDGDRDDFDQAVQLYRCDADFLF